MAVAATAQVRVLNSDMEAVAGLARLPALLAGEEREDWQKHQVEFNLEFRFCIEFNCLNSGKIGLV